MGSLSVVDKAMYSASVVERAVSVCSLDPQVNGQSAKRMTKPVRDLAVTGSRWAVRRVQRPQKSAST